MRARKPQAGCSSRASSTMKNIICIAASRNIPTVCKNSMENSLRRISIPAGCQARRDIERDGMTERLEAARRKNDLLRKLK